jgi:hypothetical protein
MQVTTKPAMMAASAGVPYPPPMADRHPVDTARLGVQQHHLRAVGAHLTVGDNRPQFAQSVPYARGRNHKAHNGCSRGSFAGSGFGCPQFSLGLVVPLRLLTEIAMKADHHAGFRIASYFPCDKVTLTFLCRAQPTQVNAPSPLAGIAAKIWL